MTTITTAQEAASSTILAVETGDELVDAAVFVVDLEDVGGAGVDVDAVLVEALADEDLGGGVRVEGELIGVQAGAGDGGEGCCYLCVDGGEWACEGEVAVGAVEPALDLRVEEEDRPGDGEPEDEGDAEESGVEVPAPDGAVVETTGDPGYG